MTTTARRRAATPEQKERAQERRAKMRQLADKISALSEAEREAVAASLPIVTIEGKRLSVFNACMIGMQLPTSTVVGGFRQWLNAGRCVRKGERGLAIWVPIGKSSSEGTEAPATGEIDADRPRFVIGTVFDVTQTDLAGAPGEKPNPMLAPAALQLAS